MKFSKQIAVAAALSACVPSFAAPRQVNLHGRVVDRAGAPVAGASVTVRRDDVVVATVTTDEQGSFMFPSDPQSYRVEIAAPSFETLRSSPIPFRTGGVTRFTLYPPGAMEKVAVSPVRGLANRAPWEVGAFVAGGLGVTDNRSSFKFFQVGAHAGKVLTPELGTGLLRGNFEYAVDVIPYWGAYTPTLQKVFCNADPGAAPGSYTCSNVFNTGGRYTGVSVTPITLRWNFTHGEHWMPWVQGAGGVVWTNHKFPAVGSTDHTDLASNGIHGDTSVWNFTPQFGVGTHYFLKDKQSLDFSANAVHISSASLGDKNPGVNASVLFSVGYTWWK